MVNYRQYKFVSSAPLIAEVMETLRSYFSTGVIDDLLFPTWIVDCLERFGKGAIPVKQTILKIENGKACLPTDFNSVRELWATTIVDNIHYQSPTSFYYETDCRITENYDRCSPCFEEQLIDECDSCSQQYKVTHKVTGNTVFAIEKSFLLTPGSILCSNMCDDRSPNLLATSEYTFDIHENNIVTSFESGVLYLTYYGATYDVDDVLLVPEPQPIRNFIRQFLYYKCYEQLFHLVSDETFNQIQNKMLFYKQQQEEAFIIALTYLKKQTIQQKRDSIKTLRSKYL